MFQKSLSKLISDLEEEKIKLEKKSEQLEEQLQNRNETINKLKISLQVEKFKTMLLTDIINKNTPIKISDIIEEKDDKIHIYNFPNGNIPIIVHDILETKNYILAVKRKPEKTIGKTFRNIKTELLDENPEIQEQKIKKVEEEMEEIVQENNLDVSYKETTVNIESVFEEIIKNRIYKKSLTSLKEYRSKLLGKLNLTDYINLIKTHIERLQSIFSKKNYDQKKIQTTVSISLSGLEQRLTFYGQYYNTELDSEDIQRLKLCLKLNMDYPKRYLPFSQTEVNNQICNYSISLFTIKEIMKRILVNPFGFPNLIYLQVEKSKEDDPYSFYSLEKVDFEGKRCWKMECRLDELSKNISEHVKNYTVNLFRKIYFDMFSDNIYRNDFLEKNPLFKEDCEQLIINIITISGQKFFCNILRSIVFKHSTIQPTKIDKFNFTRDDQIIKKSFTQDINEIDTIKSVIKRLFDNVKDEEIEKIIEKHNNL